jgi:hypothetical protein
MKKKNNCGQGQHVAMTETLAELFRTQSEILFPLEDGVPGRKQSCGRIMVIATLWLLKRRVHIDAKGKRVRVFSDEYLKQFLPKGVNWKMYSSHIK